MMAEPEDTDGLLSTEEITAFLEKLDPENSGEVVYADLRRLLDADESQIPSTASKTRAKQPPDEHDARSVFLKSLLNGHDSISRVDLAALLRASAVPSQRVGNRRRELDEAHYLRQMTLGRRFRAYWCVEGPKIVFLGIVVAMQIAFGTWQLVKYVSDPAYLEALGWGVVVAKTCAGILYPTFFFMILSMSRYLATFLRKFKFIYTYVNWDRSQSFHIKMAYVAIFFSLLHSLAHLTGCFWYATRAAQHTAAQDLLGSARHLSTYGDFIRSTPGWTGLATVGLFGVVTVLSLPVIRTCHFELFQLGHLLIFPIIALLCVHGSQRILQFPMLGIWLAIPTAIVIIERSARLFLSFHPLPASLEILDQDTIIITVTIPFRIQWPYRAGHYILLQVPAVSRFQWHPFTISTCIDNKLQVHIKTDGDWTSRVRDLGTSLQYVGVDGPFGAPSQRFFDFDQSIVIGSGIGVTPFSGILTDLCAREARAAASPLQTRKSSRAFLTSHFWSREAASPSWPPAHDEKSAELIPQLPLKGSRRSSLIPRPTKFPRRVDFHWIVKDRNSLAWFRNLLNRLSVPARPSATSALDTPPYSTQLDVRIRTYVTQARADGPSYILRWLLERHRTTEAPRSALTGLVNETCFGRPDVACLLDAHYRDMLAQLAGADGSRKVRKVGVFFCGAKGLGYQLADRCQMLTRRGREDGSKLEYHFMMEVFG